MITDPAHRRIVLCGALGAVLACPPDYAVLGDSGARRRAADDLPAEARTTIRNPLPSHHALRAAARAEAATAELTHEHE